MTRTVQYFASTFAALVFLSPTTAPAQSLSDCDDWRSSVLGIAEPWEANSKTFTEGMVRMTIRIALNSNLPGFESLFLG